MRTLVVFIALAAGAMGWSAQNVRFLRGDVNADGTVDVSDEVRLLVSLFRGGPALACPDAADANDDGAVDVADVIYALNYLFVGGKALPPPFPAPGCDPTPDGLDCSNYRANEPCDAPSDMVFGHEHTNHTALPAEWIQTAKTNFRIYYGHTSHGSQIMTGLGMIRDNLFDYNNGTGTLNIFETVGHDLGNPDTTNWAANTRAQLDRRDNDRNVVMWSWCGQLSTLSPQVVQRDYLDNMNRLEADYPGVRFVYMTGHLDGTGVAGRLNQNNELIRSFCRAGGKTLFDFADIESYDPNGNYYLDLGADDNCDYRDPADGKKHNWAAEWCAANPGECLGCASCAHSQCLNCQLKGKVFWWMMARMAGWQP